MHHAFVLVLLSSMFDSVWGAENTPPDSIISFAALPPLATQIVEGNPYRNNTLPADDTGRQVYTQTCARCHGEPAKMGRMPAPDLRRLDTYCRRISDSALQARCMLDNDAYFIKTVLSGKTIVGVEHMPAWKGVLSQESIWSIQIYIESLSRQDEQRGPDSKEFSFAK